MALHALAVVLRTQEIIEVLVRWLGWADLFAAFNTCTGCRAAWRSRAVRDLVLGRMVRGYAWARRHSELEHVQWVEAELGDVDLLLMSLKVPLDQYTTHGQSVLETRYPTLQDSYKSTKLAALCLAHSRFVLLLQALVHSCSSAWEPEPCLRRAAVRSTRLLAFPPSLSYLSQHPHVISHHHQHVMFPPPQPSFTTSLGLDLAFSRSRAPVLRVFVPCTSVNSDSILACQQHLVHAGLWHHLSVGDVVCNLGYIPPVHHLSSTIWLLFNGLSLVPYSLPDILPIDNPITLPSPFYYSHLSSTLTLSIAEFPPLNPNALPQLAMLNVNAKVKSLNAPTGRVDVTKWVWTATLTIDNHPHPQFAPEIGQGWYGQWVLEAEGTSEAKQQLWDSITNRLVPARPTQWQLLRERSGNGTIWLRMVS